MDPLGLYIHVPFCDGKCAYCNFYSIRTDEMEWDHYTTQLIKSLERWSTKINRPIKTVYFGGGTPSLLGAERLSKIIEKIKALFDIFDHAEITVELNPTRKDFDFETLRSSGANRLSVGLQSSHENELKLLGRRHSAADAAETIRKATAAGFDNISLDLMLAIPEQTVESLKESIAFCADCGVKHISSYILKIEEGTKFHAMKERLQLFDEDLEAEFYENAVKELARLGYTQYEISNFAKPGFESSHNLLYWHDEEYLGVGPSAHSFLDRKRFYYPNDIKSFYQDETVFESDGGDPEEYCMLALRLAEGLVFQKFESRYGRLLPEKIKQRASSLSDAGLVMADNTHIALTLKGFLVSNAVIAYLLD